MISLEEIKKKAARIYPQFLKSIVLGESFFPYVLRSDKNLSVDFVEMSKEISSLISGSKDRQGFGYHVSSRPVKTRNHGFQDIPELISFEQQEDYLKFIAKEREFGQFLENVNTIRDTIPELHAWISEHPLAVVNNNGKWLDLLKVCKWFMDNFEPAKYYIRELPISVHTKFVEDNKGVLREILDHLVPGKINIEEFEFEKRFQLKYVQPLVRFRSLDVTSFNAFYDDISVPLSEFAKTSPKCNRVFIVENKMNFLTFPQVTDSIVIWGKGFAIETLRDAFWLKDKEIFYWSDLDIQGFQMLSRLRSYFPQTQAFLMDGAFLEVLEDFIVAGTPAPVTSLFNLSQSEQSVFLRLKEQNWRLEQERIPQARVIEETKRLFGRT
jgi:hypothetical protein